MKRLTQILPVFLAAALQLMPLVRNLFINPATGNTFAFILRWGVGSAAALGTVDAVSGATNGFAVGTNLTITVNTTNYTTNATLFTATSGDGGAICRISNLTAPYTTNSLLAGQTTTNNMPIGLTFKFIDVNSGNATLTNVYCQIYGKPTQIGTNSFHVQLYFAGATAIDSDFKIAIVAGAGVALPAITNQPVSLTNNVSSNVTFSVTAGTAPIHYQWYFNTNTALLNATNTSLSLTNIQLTNAGNYCVIITNSSGSVTSSYVALTVWQPPVITNGPVSFTNVAGGSGNMGVIAGGFPAIAYQWRITTNLITTSLASATNASLSFTNLRAYQTGVYTVVLTNSAGSVTSAIANLVVTNPAPPVVGGSVHLGSQFQFTFAPVPGLTNTVLTNGILSGGSWGVLTNYPPTAAPLPITITNNPGAGSLFYRLLVVP
ncbi:MAG: immunoglobulin domain-containing protein [Verrucomicrobiota bacterium]